jgi:hypothetical protein
MGAQKTTRIDIRIDPVLRGKLAEEAGPHGSLSSVAREILQKHYETPMLDALKRANTRWRKKGGGR